MYFFVWDVLFTCVRSPIFLSASFLWRCPRLRWREAFGQARSEMAQLQTARARIEVEAVPSSLAHRVGVVDHFRRELRRAVDGVQKLEEERERLEGAIAEADRIFNDASARHDATVDPLDIRLKQIKAPHERSRSRPSPPHTQCVLELTIERADGIIAATLSNSMFEGCVPA